MNKLSSDTARLISSLQVITKVESVVKELVENALDAGATCIEVKFENYGLSKIEVRDNGSGIKQSDVEFAAQRHYTSKISCKEDLRSLSSYGFRGEALSSLCDVSEVFITTRTEDDKFSTKYSFNHKGVVTATKPCHLVQGTTVVANNLFSKMPVRCQFYQTPSKRKQILKNTEDVLMSFALIHPEKRFSFLHNKSMIWQKPSCKDLRSAVENVLGSNVVSQMIQVNHSNEENDIQISCFIPVTKNTRHYRKTSDRCFIYVNKRPIRDKEIEKIIKRCTTQPDSSSTNAKWPVVFASIQVSPERVDANVESDKSRVFITEKDPILTALSQTFSETYDALPEDWGLEKENQQQASSVCNNHPELSANVGQKNPGNGYVDGISCPDMVAPSGLKDPMQSTASQWSKGCAVRDEVGQPVQPVKVVTGHHGRPLAELPDKQGQQQMNNRTQKENFTDQRTVPTSHISELDNISLDESVLEEIFNSEMDDDVSSFSDSSMQKERPKLKQSFLDVKRPDISRTASPFHTPARRPSTPNSTALKQSSKKRETSRSLPDDVHNATLITKWVTQETERISTASPLLSEASEDSVEYAEGQQIDLKFNFAKLKEDLCYKADYIYAECDPYSVVGVLKDVKGGIILDNVKREMFLVNLLRLQETKLFWSLMENHAIQSKELAKTISIPVSTLNMEEMNGLKQLCRSTPNLTNPDIEYSDHRISKNGFRVKLIKGPDGSDCLEVFQMTDVVSYYNHEDLLWILRKVGSCESKVSLAESRPFKAVQFLQAEAVRMSYSLPVHSSVMENLEDLKSNLSGDFRLWECFHRKNIFQSIFSFSK